MSKLIRPHWTLLVMTCITFIAGLALPSRAQQNISRAMVISGVTRTYLMLRPSQADLRPTIIVLHGGLMSATHPSCSRNQATDERGAALFTCEGGFLCSCLEFDAMLALSCSRLDDAPRLGPAAQYRGLLLRGSLSLGAFLLEPIQEVMIQAQVVDLVKRRSMMRIIARRMKAATVLA
jgi:hypothetical protein